ncbi:hypothetical protein EY643_12045 [Halioglobus maricola]|uniref:Transcriptional regulator SutA RNAP-binding domain-containing protein n=1 Tax=Halioglobus maricola TaxID=2601894 RepID=A0A5P9NKE2_9GAMM|nr:hypothetical protein [Halioglobus maricola]QFU76333.1 hypothetical protein EY643_12045 [Halioglobus maricola]
MAQLRSKNSSRKAPAAVTSSETIAEQTKAFLESGNKIDVIESGISSAPILGAVKTATPRGN